MIQPLAKAAEADPAIHYIPKGAAYGLFFSAALALAIVAIGWTHLQVKIDQKNPAETLLSARSTQKWWGIAASFFSSSMGCWVLTAPAEVGAAAGWWGVIGYGLATSLPWLCLSLFGPLLRERTESRGFTSTDYIKGRFGWPLHILYTIVSTGIIFLGFVVEAVTIGSVYATASPQVNPILITVSLGVIVFVYTISSGIRATLLTDRVQSVTISLLILLSFIITTQTSAKRIPREAFSRVGAFTNSGFLTLVILNISCFYPTFMDPSAWSRMYSAESPSEARFGLMIASALLLIPMIFFGATGIMAQAGYEAGVLPESPLDSTVTPLFALLTLAHPAFAYIILIMATCLSSSTIDTFASGFASVIAPEISNRNLNLNYARFVTAIIFILALITAARNPPSVMTLFMVGNLISACTTPPLLLSLWPYVSAAGATLGIFGSALSICIFGWNHLDEGFRGGFRWWLLPEEEYYGYPTLMTFLVAGVVSTVLPLLFDWTRSMTWDPPVYERQKNHFKAFGSPSSSSSSDRWSSQLWESTLHSSITVTSDSTSSRG